MRKEFLERPTAPVVFVLFDLLWDKGRDLTGKNVVQRVERLEEIISPISGIPVGGYLEKRRNRPFPAREGERFGRNYREA